MGAELGAITQFTQPIAQSGFNAASTFNPQYTNLNVQNYNTALQGVAGGMNQAYQQANPGLANYTNTLGQFLNATTANTPGAAATATSNGALSAPTAAPQTNLAQVGGPGMQTVQGTTVNPQTGFNGVQAASGNAGLSAATNQLGGTGPSSIQQLLEQQAMQGLQQGRDLSWEDKRMAEQAAREGWGARGLINSTGAVASEILNRDAISRQRERERQSFASAVDQTGFGQRTQGFNNALGLSQANLGYANLGLQGQQANLAAQLQGNQLGYRAVREILVEFLEERFVDGTVCRHLLGFVERRSAWCGGSKLGRHVVLGGVHLCLAEHLLNDGIARLVQYRKAVGVHLRNLLRLHASNGADDAFAHIRRVLVAHAAECLFGGSYGFRLRE